MAVTGAYDQVWKSITGIPAANLAGKRYYFGKITSTGELNLAGAGQAVAGVIYEPNNVGQPTQVVNQGIAFIVLGATVAAGAEVQSDSNGKAVARVVDTFTAGTPDTFVEGGRRAGILLVGGDADDIGCVLLG